MTREQKYELITAAWLSDYEGSAKLVLLRIAYFIREAEGFADIGQDRLARYASCKIRQVRRAIHKLKADGVLSVKLVKEKQWHNRYTLNLAALAKHEIPLPVSHDLIESVNGGGLVGPVVEVSQDLGERSYETATGGLGRAKKVVPRGGDSGVSVPTAHASRVETGDGEAKTMDASDIPYE